MCLHVSATTFIVTDGSSWTGAVDTVSQSGQEAALTLTNALASDKMYLAWASNSSGYSSPIAINKTEAWWVGPDTVASNESFSVYGRNLQLGSTNSYLYVVENSTWLTNYAGNAYKADFLATGLTNGTYTLRAHNGQGQHYGWADSVGLTVRDAYEWDDDTNTWITATSDIESSLEDADTGDTVYVPDGNYTTSSRIHLSTSGVRVIGESTNAVISTASNFSDSSDIWFRIGDTCENIEIRNITLKVDAVGGDEVYPMWVRNASYLTFSNCVIDTTAWTMSSTRGSMPFESINYATFTDCIFYVSGGPFDSNQRTTSSFVLNNCSQFLFDGCTFYQLNDCNVSIKSFSDDIAVVNCTQDSYDRNGSGPHYYGKGRFLAMNPNSDSGFPENLYIGGCSLLDTGPREDSGDHNSGEVILNESPKFIVATDVSSGAISNTAPVASISDTEAGHLVAIVSGRGLGQTRTVQSVSGSTITISENWNVIPDTTSDVVVFGGGSRAVVYNNYFTGWDGIVEWGDSLWKTPNCGVEIYSGGYDWCIDNNVMNGTRNGIVEFNFVMDEGDGVPCYFTYIADNTISNTFYGLVNQVRLRSTTSSHSTYPISLGTTWKDNTVTNTAETAIWNGVIKAGTPTGGMRIPDSIIQNLAVYDNNTLAEFSEAYETRYGFTNQVFVGNTTNGVSWTP
jgi:hypothetical protein